MNAKTAESKGLVFTGTYGWNKDEVQARADEIKKLGYKAYVCNVPPNPLSRGHHGMGYSVYIEPRYQADETAKKAQSRICNHASRLVTIRTNFEREMAVELEAENQRNDSDVKWLTENNYPISQNA